MRSSLVVLSTASLLLASAWMAPCAAAPAPPLVAEEPGACSRLFISPSGEPFRNAGSPPPCPLEAWFAQADTNHDGALSRSEFQADAARFFAKLDRNGDGVLEPDEVERYEREIVPEILGRPREASLAPRFILAQFGGMGGGMGGVGRPGGDTGGDLPEPGQPNEEHAPQGSSPDGVSHFGLLDEPEPVASADLNFDGTITSAEFITRASQRFDALDAASSGSLTLAQLQHRMDARGGKQGGTKSSRHRA